MVYSFFTDKQAVTPQTEPIPDRASEMIQGKSGGYMFDAGIWTMVRRCLILGTATDQYYSNKHELTGEFVEVLRQAIALNPQKVADEILYASAGHAVNNHAPIFALVLLSMGENKEAKQAFKQIFKKVVRTGSHFHEWMSYTKKLRGIGRTVREVGKDWLQSQDIQSLIYQILKYQQRMGFSFKDELRLLKPKAESADFSAVYGWAAGKWKPERDPDTSPATFQSKNIKQLYWYEWLKQNPGQGERAVREGGLTHEMVAPIAQMNLNVWQALFETMPIGALIRSLASLTEIGVIRFDQAANLDRIEAVLTSKEHLRRGRIHPIDILKALKTYRSGGSLGKSSKTWEPVARVVQILEKALDLSFETLEPTGKVFLHAIDVSGSMSWNTVTSIGLKCSEIAAVMALATAKAERNYLIRGFESQFVDLGITAADSFSSACQKASDRTFGSTNASVAYDWAIANQVNIDVFCFWTDNESWTGSRHPSQALAEYRQKLNPHAKAVYTSLASNQISLCDPRDPLSFDFAGFDPSIPKAIQEIALL